MHDAVLAVPALTGEVELAVQPIEGDGRTLHEDAFHGFGAMLAEVADSLDVVVMVPGNQNVLFQIFGVVRVGTIDDAALRQRGIAAVQLFSGDNEGYLIPASARVRADVLPLIPAPMTRTCVFKRCCVILPSFEKRPCFVHIGKGAARPPETCSG